MPTSKDHESKKKKARRRPGREEINEAIMEEDFQEEASEDLRTESVAAKASSGASSETSESNYEHSSETSSEASSEEAPERKKIHIEFPYSDVVRAKLPKAFNLAENVAEEWVNDGDFENVPLPHPLAQLTVAAGLRKAKEVEKKLEEKGVFTIAKMGLEYAKSKLHKK
ncbi:MAG: hypothetical protein ACXWRE_11485 [Pseudobdellovibrionaceae bacterium]